MALKQNDIGDVNQDHKVFMVPYSFAKTYGILIDDHKTRKLLCLHKNAVRKMIPEVLRVSGHIDEIKEFSQKEYEDLLSSIYASRSLQEDIDTSLDDQKENEDLDSIIEDFEATADLLAGDDDAPIIRLLNSLLSEAVRSGASDIHLEPFDNKVTVRLRIDGILTELATLSPKLAPYLVSRIKVMARLDIAEKRVPQDGRLSLTLGGKAFDVRISTLPIRYGERVVMRLLDTESAQIKLAELGMPDQTYLRLRDTLSESNGIILVTGPTGSGKTTTLYAALTLLNDQTRNIMTVEDPVEYALPGVSQTQVNNKVGMTFAGGLRSILRQDPDVVMIGEIRDMETAEMAVQASLTGHLVLSTVHTNSSVSAVTRLVDMGVERFLLASTIKGILAQRLVRKLCQRCKKPISLNNTFLKYLDVKDQQTSTIYEAVGCDDCNHKGYSGRTGIYELLVINNKLREMIQNEASEQAIEAVAFNENPTLSDSGRELVLAGVTTIEEVMRVSKLQENGDASL